MHIAPHKTQLEALIQGFLENTADLFTVTKPPEHFEAEKGLYGRLYAKPSKRLSRLLTADRELLVLFTTFSQQQVRTVKIARQIIDASQNRLESSLAIVVHCDPNGNGKLKSWGTGDRLAILPVYVSGPFPKPDALEHALGNELYSFDPFDVTGPVSEDSQFYGRRNEAQAIARQLQSGQIRACLGIRKIGKTSIINRIFYDTRLHHHCYSVMIDCSQDSVWQLRAGDLLNSLGASIDAASNNPVRSASLAPIRGGVKIEHGALALRSSIEKAKLPVILFFDEVDYITPDSPTAPHWRTEFNPFWRNFRAVYQDTLREGRKLSLLVSGISSKWFLAESVDGVENAALAFIPESYLSPFARKATVEMIKTLARTCGLQMDEAVCNAIAAACSDIPFWTRKACSYIHRQIDIGERPCQLSLPRVEPLIAQFIRDEGGTLAQVAIRHLFRVYSDLEATAEKCLASADISDSSRFAAILSRYGIFSETHGRYRLSGEMVKEGLRLHLAERSGAPTGSPSLKNLSFGSVDEWADELALVNKRRNLLEKTLRDIVVNFIRFDSLNTPTKGTVSERLLRVLEENQRRQHSSRKPEQIAEKFTWTDLVKVIQKEWPLFERMLGDKNNFALQASLVNDRFDTHAKTADAADLALYRRALVWFEEKVSGS